jgi:hypothetical protein
MKRNLSCGITFSRALYFKAFEGVTFQNFPAVKVKVKLSPSTHHAMKVYWGNGSITPSILDFGTR